MQHVAFDVNEIYNLLGGEHILVQLLIYAGSMDCFIISLRKRYRSRGEIQLSMESMFPMVTIFLIVWILSVLETSGLASFQAPVGSRIFYRIIDGLCCFLCPVGAGEPKRKKPF